MKTISCLARAVLQQLLESERKLIGCDSVGLADDDELDRLQARLGAPRRELIIAVDELWTHGFLRVVLAPLIDGIRETGWLIVDL